MMEQISQLIQDTKDAIEAVRGRSVDRAQFRLSVCGHPAAAMEQISKEVNNLGGEQASLYVWFGQVDDATIMKAKRLKGLPARPEPWCQRSGSRRTIDENQNG